MSTTTISGVDATVTSIGEVTTFTYPEASETPKQPEPLFPPPPPPNLPDSLPVGTYYGFIHASNVQYYVARLLGNALSLVDATIPNKDQNKAFKHLLRKEFDRAIMDIHEMAWPLTNGDLSATKAQQAVSTPIDGYILQPER